MSAKNASSIQVCIKVRPCEPGLTSLWQVKEGRSIHLADSHAEPYVFDYVFDEGASNQDVFDRMARHIVHACMQGFNGTIFAYGQTSSGKTYTMMGDEQNPGVMVLAAKEIFQQITSETERDFLLRVGYIEIYNEKIYDLLNKKNQDLMIHESGNGIVNVNCKESIVTSEDDLLRLLCMGNKERIVGENNMNERSSRSHAIFRIIIESRKSDHSDDDTVNQSVLSLVDLAGSEQVEHADALGHASSLMIFRNLVKSRSENVDIKPNSFRDSKLPRIMLPSLGENVLTSIICTITPSFVEESSSTISFATCAIKIRCKPQVCKMDSESTMMGRLDRGICMLKKKLAEKKIKNESQLVLQELEGRIKRDKLKIISSASLNDYRLQKRRRTWTLSASGSEGDSSVPALPEPEESRLPRPSKLTNLPKPNTTHSQRREIAPKTKGIYKSLKEKTFQTDNMNTMPVQAKQRETASRIPSVMMPKKDQESVPNCDALQIEISALTASNQVAKETIEKYEEQVKRLKETIERLEMENGKAVNLGEQFETHKAKSKQMKEELLSSIFEKDSTIESLQLSLKELSRDVLRNSKEDFMRSMCPELESSCERICNKCLELERLLPIASASGLESIACQCDQLRSEIADTRIKLESMQSAFSQASCEVSQKTTDCKRLSEQISTAQDDFGQLQEKYNNLEHKLSSQQLAIGTMQADYTSIQQRYLQLQEEYKHLELRSDEQCQQLQDENSKLQAEIGTLKERVEEVQSKLLEVPNPGSHPGEMELQNRQLKKRLSELESEFNEIRRNYECLSTQLMDSIQESDVLREELKQRTTNGDLESMKRSGVGAQCSDPENDLLQQFAKLSKSIQQIELSDYSGGRRLFIHNHAEQDQSVPSFKLCLEPADYLKGDGKQQDTSDSVFLKGSQIVKINQEQNCVKEEDRMCDIILQLKQEVDEKKNLIEEEKGVIDKLRAQITSLKQIETVVNQNGKTKILCDELQTEDNVQTTMKQSLLSIPHGDDTITIPSSANEQESHEVLTLKTSLAHLKSKVCELQKKLENQSEDEKISELQADIGEISERCLSMEQKLADFVNWQAQELRPLDQLQDSGAELQHSSTTAEESLKLEKPIQEQTDRTLTTEYERRIEQLEESLQRAQEELRILEKRKTDENKSLQLEYMAKIETSENENRSKFRAYCLELEETKKRYEEQLQQASEKLTSVTTQCQADLDVIKGSLQEKITQAEKERNELAARHKAELEKINETLKEKESSYKEKLSQAEEERDKEVSILEAMRNTIAELHKTNSKREVELEGVKMEKCQLKELYDKSLLELKELQRTADQKSSDLLAGSSKEDIDELQRKCDQYVMDLELLRGEKAELLSEIQKINAQHSKTLKKLEEIEAEMITLTTQKDLERCDIKEKLETFKSKEADLKEALHCAQLRFHAYDELVCEHERLKGCLSDSNKMSANLQKKVADLQAELLSLQEGISGRDSEIKQLRAELKDALDENTTARKAKVDLENSLKEVQENMSTQAGEVKRKIANLKGSVDELQLKLKSLQEVKDNLESENEKLKIKLNDAQNLQNKVDKEQKLNSSLREDLGKLEQTKLGLEEQLRAKKVEIDRRSKELGELTQECGNIRSHLAAQTNDFLKEKETLNLTISNLQLHYQQLGEKLTIHREKDKCQCQLKTKLESLLETSKDHVSNKAAENNLNLQMKKDILDLTKECEILRSDLQSKIEYFRTHEQLLDKTISNLKEENRKMEEKFSTVNKALNEDCEKLRSTLKSKELIMQQNRQELEERLTVIDEKNGINARLVAQLKSNEDALKSLREDSIKQSLAIEAANKRSHEMEQKVNKRAREYEELRSTLKTREIHFRSEKERMDGTISILLEDKRNLEEKVCTVTELLAKLERKHAQKVNGGDVSFELNSSNGSPTPVAVPATKKPLDCNSADSVPKKSISLDTAERKNRRMTAYDEHRKQFCWNDLRNGGTTTVPVDGNCHCEQLSCKQRLSSDWRQNDNKKDD
ncbi:kinesin-like protein KIN-7I isoform X1 [Drosophila sechellia]|uniref:GM18973 n=2 Tax=Drosophila sechellia TaxID=7238 RepID=B4HX35_DROSE|nr:kinesin-like protein KIN-7I isoform X1 [Drosophila sechellia]EDW52580.1 GM18973 [Drosophila sechellia]